MTDRTELERHARQGLTSMIENIDPDAPVARDELPSRRSGTLLVAAAGIAVVVAGAFVATRGADEGEVAATAGADRLDTQPGEEDSGVLVAVDTTDGNVAVSGTAPAEAVSVRIVHSHVTLSPPSPDSEAPAADEPPVTDELTAPTSSSTSGDGRSFEADLPVLATGYYTELAIVALDDAGTEIARLDIVLRGDQPASDCEGGEPQVIERSVDDADAAEYDPFGEAAQTCAATSD